MWLTSIGAPQSTACLCVLCVPCARQHLLASPRRFHAMVARNRHGMTLWEGVCAVREKRDTTSHTPASIGARQSTTCLCVLCGLCARKASALDAMECVGAPWSVRAPWNDAPTPRPHYTASATSATRPATALGIPKPLRLGPARWLRRCGR